MQETKEKESENEVLSKEEYAYGFIIEVLTKGLYPNKFHVIREYVQNSFDAISKWRKDPEYDNKGEINIKIDGNSILIYDNGTGMNLDKIKQYRYVGYSEKILNDATGFRGIGKLAGISIAQKLIVTTSPYNEDKRYRLEFNADLMILEILELKSKGENIPLNSLIKKYTDITTENEDKNEHYTLVELHNVRTDSKDLLNKDQIVKFLGLNVPVGFDPEFEYGEEIHKTIEENVPDYEIVKILVNENEVYKPYLKDCKNPQFSFIWKDDEKESVEDNIDDNSLLAFCWYCQNKKEGQFEERDQRGLFYKCKNFTVGDQHLTRQTLWKASPERAFYFFGEIYIADKEIFPTSERNNLVQNDARERLFKKGEQISKSLNKLAQSQSNEQRAIKKIEQAEGAIQEIEKDYKEGKISKEIKFDKMVAAYNIEEEVQKRVKKAPEGYQKKGREVIKRARDLVAQFKEKENKDSGKHKFYDICGELSLSSEEKRLYKLIVSTIRDACVDNIEFYETLIEKIDKNLRDKLR